MKVFNIIGIAATIWVGYILLNSDSLNAGLNEVKKRVVGDIDPVDRTKEIIVTSGVKKSPSAVATIDPTLKGLSNSEANATQVIKNNLDFGVNSISTTPDQFTKEGRAQYQDWQINKINAGWEETLVG
jgi:hypothetical protein